MKNTFSLLIFMAVISFSSSSQSANNAGDKPKCQMNKITKLVNGRWQCVTPKITSNASVTRQKHNGLNCPKGYIEKVNTKTGKKACKKLGLSSGTKPSIPAIAIPNFLQMRTNQKSSSSNAAVGSKPKCRLGKLAKLVNGNWKCVQPHVTSPKLPQNNATVGQRPKCRAGLISKLDNGSWKCVTPGKKAR